MSSIKPVHGVLWQDGVIANCVWGGVRLRDLLVHAGVFLPAVNTESSLRHVCFSSHAAPCTDDSYYGASISLQTAMDPDADVLLAYEVRLRSLVLHISSRSTSLF